MRKWVYTLSVILLAMGIAGVLVAAARLSSITRERAIQILSERFDSEVELGTVQVTSFPLSVSGEGLVLRHQGRTDVPPLITIGKFQVTAGLIGLLRRPLPPHAGEGIMCPECDKKWSLNFAKTFVLR